MNDIIPIKALSTKAKCLYTANECTMNSKLS